MSSDYNYDENGQFFPFFILTLTGLVTLPLTYNVLKKNAEIEHTAPRIKSDFKAKHDDLIQTHRRAQKRKEFKTKRTIAVVIGYLVMAWMVYKIIVTQRIVPKIWDPYDILGLSRVRCIGLEIPNTKLTDFRVPASKQSRGTRGCRRSNIIQTK